MGENLLKYEKGPYLKAHQNNPVWWQPWNQDTLKKAKNENKIIFLSIGYSTCHWCHVMEKESFEDEQVAEFLNKYFISIKVDREERPDIDQLYMRSVQMMGVHGGWPLSVFLAPDLNPFFGGTYFPKDHFLNILSNIQSHWVQNQESIIDNGQKLFKALNQTEITQRNNPVDYKKLNFLLNKQLEQEFDSYHGGFGNAPKFPPCTKLLFLIQEINSSNKSNQQIEQQQRMVENTLTGMYRGGLYDHIGGGFARYSTDQQWLIPHFEKMLYDNAQLVNVYLNSYRTFKNPLYLNIALETLSYLFREMQSDQKAFYSAQDADSDGVEGKYYIWSWFEIHQLLHQNKINESEIKILTDIFGVTQEGNFEEKTNHLNLLSHEKIPDTYQNNIQKLKKKMIELRYERKLTLHRDEKIICSWNALLVPSFCLAFKITNDEQYYKAAFNICKFIQNNLIQDYQLKRRFCDGQISFNGNLDDYAYFIEALIIMYQTDYDRQWLLLAKKLQEQQIHLFWDQKKKLFQFSRKDHQDLIAPTHPLEDGDKPSPIATSLHNLGRLNLYFHSSQWAQIILDLQNSYAEFMEKYPTAVSRAFSAINFIKNAPKLLTLLGKGSCQITQSLLIEIKTKSPDHILTSFLDIEQELEPNEMMPWEQGKEIIKDLNSPQLQICNENSCLDQLKSVNEIKDLILTWA